MKSLLLTYNLDPATEARLRALCGRMMIDVRAVPAEAYGEAIGVLAGLPVARPAASGPALGFSDPMIVMCGLLAPQFNALLEAMRAQGVRVALKCVRTPTNAGWNSIQLRDELSREHEAMRRAREGS